RRRTCPSRRRRRPRAASRARRLPGPRSVTCRAAVYRPLTPRPSSPPLDTVAFGGTESIPPRNREETWREGCSAARTVLQTSIPTIQVAATAGILDYTRSGGGDVAWVVDSAKLTLEELERPEHRLPLRKFVTLIEAASRSTGDDCFGAHL